MNKQKLKQIILSEIKDTEMILEEFKEITKPVAPDDSIGRVSRVDAINNKSTAEYSERQAKNKLNDLRTQLNRLETDEFGKCQNCGEEIPLDRIIFMPESLFCIKCIKK
jgi:DnaK suppressor protein